MKEDDKPQEESNRFDRNRLGFSDPTPALPEGEGARFETNESITANETDSLYTPEIDFETIKPVTDSEADSIPSWEGWGGVRKPGYITANPYTYPVIKDYRKNLKDHQTKAELILWKYLRTLLSGKNIK